MKFSRRAIAGLGMILASCTFPDWDPNKYCFEMDDWQAKPACRLPADVESTETEMSDESESHVANETTQDHGSADLPSSDISQDILSPADTHAEDSKRGDQIDLLQSQDPIVDQTADQTADQTLEDLLQGDGTLDVGYDSTLLLPPELPILSQPWTSEYQPDGACVGLFHFSADNPMKNECGIDATDHGTSSVEGAPDFGQARAFTGAARLTFPIKQPEQEFTFECYVTLSQTGKYYTGNYATIWSVQKDGKAVYALQLLENNVFQFVIYEEKKEEKTLAVAPSLSSEKPTHISVVFGEAPTSGAKQVRIYLNGVIQGSKMVQAKGFVPDIVDVIIGSDTSTDEGNNFIGTLDEVRYSVNARDKL